MQHPCEILNFLTCYFLSLVFMVVDWLASIGTALVIDALRKSHQVLRGKGFVSCNHFDVDGLLSVFALMYPTFALENAELLIETAHLGDFRQFTPSIKTGNVLRYPSINV